MTSRRDQRRRGSTTIAAPIGTPRKPAAGKMQGAADPRYRSYAWKKLRNTLIAERKNCQGECKGFWPAKYADHIVEVKDDTSDTSFFDENNIAVLCPQCHARKTAAEKAKREGRRPPRERPMKCRTDPKTGLPIGPHWWNSET